tara:strand:+ start:23 stop:166 length:144 start_codon:yes stop_codon:yes gene_type:complete
MAEKIWDGFIILIVAALLGVFVFKLILLPDEANIFQINKIIIQNPPL